jgi:hypothetical protein
MLAVVSLAGLHQDHARHSCGFMVELARRDVFGDQTADQIVAGFALFAPHQLLDIDVHRSEGRRLLLFGGPGVQSDRGLALEDLEVVGRYTQQQRDHHGRHW